MPVKNAQRRRAQAEEDTCTEQLTLRPKGTAPKLHINTRLTEETVNRPPDAGEDAAERGLAQAEEGACSEQISPYVDSPKEKGLSQTVK